MSSSLPIPRVATVLEGEPVTIIAPDVLRFKAKMAIDSDGSSGGKASDPDWQGDTSLHHQGKALDAQTIPFVALSPKVIRAVPGTVLGCLVELIHLRTGKRCLAVAGDVGPMEKLGEASPAAARALGIPDDPRHGGVDEHVVEYTLFAGVPAVLGDQVFTLQKMG